jgi:hypothetical protein
MKTLAYALYVVVVLLISGLARANAMTLETTQYFTPATIAQVSLDQSHARILVDGSFPNPCYGQPSAMMIQDPNQPNVLVLHLSSPTPMDECITQVKDFNTSVSLARLAESSQVNVDPKSTYTLKVNGSNFEAPIQGKDLLFQ